MVGFLLHDYICMESFPPMTSSRSSIQLCRLQRDDIERIWNIDRSEVIHQLYRIEQGQLHLYPAFFDMRGWPEGEAEHYTPLLLDCYDRGGWCMGLFIEDDLIGAAIVDNRWLGPHSDMLQLKFLHVSCAYRGRGLGTQLYRAAAAYARSLEARCLYVCATPSQRTIDFYLALGFTPSSMPDPVLLALEPNDIHLEGPVVG